MTSTMRLKIVSAPRGLGIPDQVLRPMLLAFAVLLFVPGPRALAGAITAHVGPPSVGSGGANPVSIPPLNPLEWEVTYITDKDYEMNFAITPGLLFGVRSENAAGIYVSFGGGLVLSANGGGPGIYSSFGINAGDKIMFNAEIKQALGFDFSHNAVVSPYALRIGATFPL